MPNLDVIANRYEVLSCLAEGAAGAVYSGRHVLLETSVQLTVVEAGPESDPSSIERFLGNARRAQGMRPHKRIARMLDVGRDGERYFRIDEMGDGVPLASVEATHGPLTTPQLLQLATALVEALVAAHASGVSHEGLGREHVLLARGAPGGAMLAGLGAPASPASMETDYVDLGRLLGRSCRDPGLAGDVRVLLGTHPSESVRAMTDAVEQGIRATAPAAAFDLPYDDPTQQTVVLEPTGSPSCGTGSFLGTTIVEEAGAIARHRAREPRPASEPRTALATTPSGQWRRYGAVVAVVLAAMLTGVAAGRASRSDAHRPPCFDAALATR